MKIFVYLATICMVFFALANNNLIAAEELPKIGVVNFKACVEKSKKGQQEKNALEALKKQMATMLEKAEKEIEDIQKKLEDQDYMDGLSPAAEDELKQRYQSLHQDYARYQNQSMQMLNQANYKVLQSLQQYVNKASESIAKAKQLFAVVNDDALFYFDSSLDITSEIIKEMDKRFDAEHETNDSNINNTK